jgi:hypothetical protein
MLSESLFLFVSLFFLMMFLIFLWSFNYYVQGAYKLLEDFAKPYLHKYWAEIHDVANIWKRNVCSLIVTLNAFDVRPTCDTADVQAILPFPPNPLRHVLCDASSLKITRLDTPWSISILLSKSSQNSCCLDGSSGWSYGITKSSDNLYASCTVMRTSTAAVSWA